MIRPSSVVYVARHWKLIVHLLLGTRRFGVNNQRWSSFDSLFVRTERLSLRLLVRRYKLAEMRAVDLGFLHPGTCKSLGWDKY